MQTILVPIDFTAASENALVYANKLAVRLPAEIVLVQAGTGGALAPTPRIELLARLQALAERLTNEIHVFEARYELSSERLEDQHRLAR